MSYSSYHWCVVPHCKSTSVKTPEKLFIKVPNNDITMRNIWFKLANRDSKLLSEKSPLYFCEDHFDLENDMENYIKYKIMGSVKRIRMKPNCKPSRFDCQSDRICMLTQSEPQSGFTERQRVSLIQEIKHTSHDMDSAKIALSTSCVPDLSNDEDVFPRNERKHDKAVQVQIFPNKEHKAVQANKLAHVRSKYVQTTLSSVQLYLPQHLPI